MRLSTIRLPSLTRAAVAHDDHYIELPFDDVGALLAEPDWRVTAESANGARHDADEVGLAPVVPHPPKIICVGLNYLDHVNEGGHPPPQYPALFAKLEHALIGANDSIRLPPNSSMVDYEAELAVVIGAKVRNADRATASDAVAGYTIMNDVSVRDFQMRTSQWMQGKNFEATTPFGPWLVTPDETGPVADFHISCEVDDLEVQSESCGRLIFDVPELIAYISAIMTLVPGDVIATGTPGGVGKARTPPLFLDVGTTVRTAVSAIGECVNTCVRD